jgi:hypothetical protein
MAARVSSDEATEITAYLAEPTNDIYMRMRRSKEYPQRRGSVERLVDMCRARLRGETIRTIAERYAVNFERVRQLLADCRRVGRRRLARLGMQRNGKIPANNKPSILQ